MTAPEALGTVGAARVGDGAEELMSEAILDPHGAHADAPAIVAAPRLDVAPPVANGERRRAEARPLDLAVAVVAFEAASTITSVLDRVPGQVHGLAPRILVSDDGSSDPTGALASAWAATTDLDAVVEVAARNRGYGGNQKGCYRWALDNGVDVVVLLHGDAQYPPEMIDRLVGPLIDGSADAVFGSRMMPPKGALAGRMPWNRFLGNRVLTAALNRLAGVRLTEWFSGFRAYRTSLLAELELDAMSDGFDFDTAIILSIIERGGRIAEVPIPTRYAGEVSRVPLLATGMAALGHGWAHRRRSGER